MAIKQGFVERQKFILKETGGGINCETLEVIGSYDDCLGICGWKQGTRCKESVHLDRKGIEHTGIGCGDIGTGSTRKNSGRIYVLDGKEYELKETRLERILARYWQEPEC